MYEKNEQKGNVETGGNVETALKQHRHLHRSRSQYKMLLQQPAVARRTSHGTPGMRLRKRVAQQPGGWLVLTEEKQTTEQSTSLFSQ